jgi:hypothetical protein
MSGILPAVRGSVTKLLVAAGLAAALAGCGETTIDSGKLEADIEEEAAEQGLVVDAVDCPSPEVEKGEQFACTVTVKGEKRELEVTQRTDEGNVAYDLTPLLESSAGSDAGGDEASVRFVIDAVNSDPTALCDYATARYRRELGGDRCAKRAIAKYAVPMRDYTVAVAGDTASVRGGDRGVMLERQRDGSWLIAAVSG